MAVDGHIGYTKRAITSQPLPIDVMFGSSVEFLGSADLMVQLSTTFSDPETKFQGHSIV